MAILTSGTPRTAQGVPNVWEAKKLICITSMLNDACGFLGIFMTRKMLGSLSEVLRVSTKPMEKMIEE